MTTVMMLLTMTMMVTMTITIKNSKKKHDRKVLWYSMNAAYECKNQIRFYSIHNPILLPCHCIPKYCTEGFVLTPIIILISNFMGLLLCLACYSHYVTMV